MPKKMLVLTSILTRDTENVANFPFVASVPAAIDPNQSWNLFLIVKTLAFFIWCLVLSLCSGIYMSTAFCPWGTILIDADWNFNLSKATGVQSYFSRVNKC